jgi:hypothetical protein
MTSTPLKYVAQSVVDSLKDNIAANRDRYTHGDFLELSEDNGWEILSDKVKIDTEALQYLDGTDATAEADIENSLIIYSAIEGMTPALAREERVWVRLCHIECLHYARARWIKKFQGEELDKAVQDHFFAQGRTGIRDDNAISRLWWNMHIATIADPDAPEEALRLILKTADIRQAIVERPNTASREPLARALVRAMRSNPWITSTEKSFREFMKEMNRDAGGILFEAISDSDADTALKQYAENARRRLTS